MAFRIWILLCVMTLLWLYYSSVCLGDSSIEWGSASFVPGQWLQANKLEGNLPESEEEPLIFCDFIGRNSVFIGLIIIWNAKVGILVKVGLDCHCFKHSENESIEMCPVAPCFCADTLCYCKGREAVAVECGVCIVHMYIQYLSHGWLIQLLKYWVIQSSNSTVKFCFKWWTVDQITWSNSHD